MQDRSLLCLGVLLGVASLEQTAEYCPFKVFKTSGGSAVEQTAGLCWAVGSWDQAPRSPSAAPAPEAVGAETSGMGTRWWMRCWGKTWLRVDFFFFIILFFCFFFSHDLPCQSGCCQLSPSIAPSAYQCCSRGAALSSHRSPQQAHCWGGGGPVTAGRRRRTTQKREKKSHLPK